MKKQELERLKVYTLNGKKALYTGYGLDYFCDGKTKGHEFFYRGENRDILLDVIADDGLVVRGDRVEARSGEEVIKSVISRHSEESAIEELFWEMVDKLLTEKGIKR